MEDIHNLCSKQEIHYSIGKLGWGYLTLGKPVVVYQSSLINTIIDLVTRKW